MHMRIAHIDRIASCHMLDIIYTYTYSDPLPQCTCLYDITNSQNVCSFINFGGFITTIVRTFKVSKAKVIVSSDRRTSRKE